MLRQMRKLFKTIIINSLNTQQVNYLGVLYDSSFDRSLITLKYVCELLMEQQPFIPEEICLVKNLYWQ